MPTKPNAGYIKLHKNYTKRPFNDAFANEESKGMAIRQFKCPGCSRLLDICDIESGDDGKNYIFAGNHIEFDPDSFIDNDNPICLLLYESDTTWRIDDVDEWLIRANNECEKILRKSENAF